MKRRLVTKEEIKELLVVLNYYLLGGAAMGITAGSIAASFGGAITHSTYGLPVSTQGLTALVVVLIGLFTSLLGFVILIPAELKIIRKRLEPKILAERLSRKK